MTRNEEKNQGTVLLCICRYQPLPGCVHCHRQRSRGGEGNTFRSVHHRLQEHSHQPLFRSPMLYG